MYAIVRAGAKQKKVIVGDVIEIDTITTAVGDGEQAHTTGRARQTPIIGPMFTAADLSWDEFLRRHWQRAPWFAAGALPAAGGSVSRAELFALARREDVESRLVQRQGRRWVVHRLYPHRGWITWAARTRRSAAATCSARCARKGRSCFGSC